MIREIKEVVAIAVGYGAMVWFGALAVRARIALGRASNWPSTQGKIIESTLYKDPDRKGTHFRIRYEFQLGEKIEGRTPRLSGDWFWSNKQQAAFVYRYAPGQDIEIFYDPADPTRNCLDRADDSGIWAMWVLAVGGALLASLLVWHRVGQ